MSVCVSAPFFLWVESVRSPIHQRTGEGWTEEEIGGKRQRRKQLSFPLIVRRRKNLMISILFLLSYDKS